MKGTKTVEFGTEYVLDGGKTGSSSGVGSGRGAVAAPRAVLKLVESARAAPLLQREQRTLRTAPSELVGLLKKPQMKTRVRDGLRMRRLWSNYMLGQ